MMCDEAAKGEDVMGIEFELTVAACLCAAALAFAGLQPVLTLIGVLAWATRGLGQAPQDQMPQD